MSEDLSWRYWHLAAHMSEVIKSHGYYTESSGEVGRVTVRWDSTIFNASKIPSDIFSLKLLGCLKEFEFVFINLRQIDRAVINDFISYCNQHRRLKVKLLELNNSGTDMPLTERYVQCTLQVNEFTFKYWNNDFLPNMSIEVAT